LIKAMTTTDLLFLSILAFLVPVAVYCWVLSYINRRVKPTMVSGTWDSAGMMLAASGILLVVFPFLLYLFFLRKYQGEFSPEGEQSVLYWWGTTWCLYFALLVFGVARALWTRRNRTVFYNVDAEAFGHVLSDVMGTLELKHARLGNRLVIWEQKQEQRATTEVSHACAELVVEAFPPMCNVTLRWVHGEAKWRPIFEKHLADELDRTRLLDNPSAGWLMGMSGVLFGLIFLTILVWLLINYFPPRHL
jgi:hypothetical protein